MDSKREGDHRYHNPDPLYHLIGPANEIESIIEGKVLPTLVDSGAQCSSITLDMVKELKLDLHPLDTLQLRGWGGGEVRYLGYTECTLEIPKVKGFKQDILLLVVNDSEYWARVPILLGTLHINMILEEATLEEIKNLPAAWKRGSVGSMVLVKEAQLDQGQEILNLTAKVKLSKNLTIPGLQAQKVSVWDQ